jgi:hypothetical protein
MTDFIKRALSEADGTPSFSRTLSAFVIIMPYVWITFIVFKSGKFPDFGGVTLLITGVVGVVMGLNKAPAIASAITGTAPPSGTQDTK